MLSAAAVQLLLLLTAAAAPHCGAGGASTVPVRMKPPPWFIFILGWVRRGSTWKGRSRRRQREASDQPSASKTALWGAWGAGGLRLLPAGKLAHTHQDCGE